MNAALDTTLSALADPTRRAILARLARGEATVNQLTAPMPISQPAVSRHLKVLEGAGLITRRVDGAHRPCRLAPGALDELDGYLAMLRKGLERSYQRLDALLARMPAASATPSAPSIAAPPDRGGRGLTSPRTRNRTRNRPTRKAPP